MSLLLFLMLISPMLFAQLSYCEQPLNSAVPIAIDNKHQVVFHPKGRYATTATFIHLRLFVNVSEVELGMENAIKAINGQALVSSAQSKPIKMKIAETQTISIKELHSDVKNLLASVPPKSKQRRLHKRSSNSRSTGQLVLQTLTGSGASAETERLASEADEAKLKQNKIIDVQRAHKEHITSLQQNLETMEKSMIDLFHDHPSVYGATCQSIVQHVKESHSTLSHTLKEALQNRLSPKLLTSEVLDNTFKQLKQRAAEDDYILLISKPRELFEVDVSYLVSQDRQLMLIIHVPIVRKGSLMTLYQLKPFPFTQGFANNTAMTPYVGSEDMIAVTQRDGKYQYRVLGNSDLMQCFTFGITNVCQESNVLRTHLEDTCMGSLYGQRTEGVKRNCKFELKERSEIVYPIGRDQYLVYSKEQHQATIVCPEETYNLHVPTLSKMRIQGGCTLKLQDNILMPEADYNVDSDIIHLQWEWDSLSLFPQMESEEINTLIRGLKESGAHVLTAKDIQRYRLESRTYFHTNTNTYLIIGLIAVLILVPLLLCIFFRKKAGVCRSTMKPWQRETVLPVNPIFLPNYAPPSYNYASCY